MARRLRTLERREILGMQEGVRSQARRTKAKAKSWQKPTALS